jgi:hypothetical protein
VIGAPTVVTFSGGALSAALAPTDSAMPSGQYYKVTCAVPKQTVNGHSVGPFCRGRVRNPQASQSGFSGACSVHVAAALAASGAEILSGSVRLAAMAAAAGLMYPPVARRKSRGRCGVAPGTGAP